MVGRKAVLWLAILMVAAANGLVLLGSRAKERSLRADVASLPANVGGWAGSPVVHAREVQDFGGDDVLSRGYAQPTGERLWLYVGYWRRYREGRPIALSPRRAHPGPEWKAVSSAVAWIDGGGQGGRIPVRQVVFERFNEREAVTYWYVQGRGRIVTDWYLGRLAMVWDAVRWGRSDVALVRLASAVSRRDTAAVLEDHRQFAARIAPDLASRLPE